ncbi:hypothetical protein BABINDRAFT_159971 [Babjeviella inositovora NRRL Y-12698]|uniref:Ras-GAP domain-containing protein n=1 Tax=Babjeviella inositovora NRRL Y-12698 TaxID=984486 RepID=A0A1E3QXA6_9ASCO|nr:uncharacterized protein BABINDRAFT_159971 [Babjeviella inositovora NRRL Y-12698]ODQ81722.1 hypothetical protein BABINDRAFT_159971 [Babjeviella inositovora NRRL Y-12698]
MNSEMSSVDLPLEPPSSSLVACVFKKIASLLPSETGLTVSEVENTAYFLASRTGLNDVFKHCFYDFLVVGVCDILDKLNKNDKNAPLKKRREAALGSLLISVRLLADMLEMNWSARETAPITVLESADGADYNFITGVGMAAANVYYHVVAPQAVDTSVARRAIALIAGLKSTDPIRKELATISPHYAFDDTHQYRNLIRNIDLNCDAILGCFAASNPREFSDFAMNSLNVIKYSPTPGSDVVPSIELFGLIRFNEKLLTEYLRTIWHSFSLIQKPIHQQLFLSFFTKSLNNWVTTQTQEFLDCIALPDSALVAQVDRLFDFVYSQFETHPNVCTFQFLSVLICILPDHWRVFASAPSLRALFVPSNKKEKFVHNLARTIRNSTDFEYLAAAVTIFNITARIYLCDPNSPIVRSSRAHAQLISEKLTITDHESDHESRLNKLRTDYFCYEVVTHQDQFVATVLAHLSDHEIDYRYGRVLLGSLKILSRMPETRDVFLQLITSVGPILQNVLVKTLPMAPGSDAVSEVHSIPTLRSLNGDERGSITASDLWKKQDIQYEGSLYTSYNNLVKECSGSNASISSSSITSEKKKSSGASMDSRGKSSFDESSNFSHDQDGVGRLELYVDIMTIFCKAPHIYFSSAEAYGISKDEFLLPVVMGLSDPDLAIVEAAGNFVITILGSCGKFDDHYDSCCQIAVSQCMSVLGNSISECDLRSDRLLVMLELLTKFVVTRSNNEKARELSFVDLFAGMTTNKSHNCQLLTRGLEPAIIYCLCSSEISTFRVVQQLLKYTLLDVSWRDHDPTCPNFKNAEVYAAIADQSYVVTGSVALHKRIRKMMRDISLTEGVVRAWGCIYDRWYLGFQLRSSLTNLETGETRNFGGCLASMAGAILTGREEDAGIYVELVDKVAVFVTLHVEALVTDTLVLRDAVMDVVSNELHPLTYSITMKLIMEAVKALDVSTDEAFESSLLFFDLAVLILTKVVLDPNPHAIVSLRYGHEVYDYIASLIVSTPDSPPLLKLKIRLCKFITALEANRDALCYKGEVRRRTATVRLLSEWLEKSVFQDGTVNGVNPKVLPLKLVGITTSSKTSSEIRRLKEVEMMYLDLALESSRALSLALEGHTLATPQATSSKDLKHSKKLVFGNYFSLFYRVLEKFNQKGKTKQDASPLNTHKTDAICELMIICSTKLFQSNVEAGLRIALPYCYHENQKTRLSFIHVFINIATSLQNSEQENFKWTTEKRDTVIAKFLLDYPSLAVAVADACPVSQTDFLATSFLFLYDNQEDLLRNLAALVVSEINYSTRHVDILRRNSVATKLLSMYGKKYGSDYLRAAIKPTLCELEETNECFEVEKLDPADPLASLNVDRFMKYLTQLVDAIVSSAHAVPDEIRFICSTIDKAVQNVFPDASIVAIGSFMFLRFFGPAIVSPESADIFSVFPGRNLKRSLIQLAKAIQHMANGSLASLKWPLLSTKEAELSELNKKVVSYLGSLRYDSRTFTFKSKMASPEVRSNYLHKFIYDTMLSICITFLDGSNINACEERLAIFRKFDNLLFLMGQPEAVFGYEIPNSIKNDGNTVLFDFMNKYSTKDLESLIDIPFVQAGIAVDGTPTLNLCFSYIENLQMDFEILAYRIFQVASKVWDSKFYIVCDFSCLNTYEHCELLVSICLTHTPEVMSQNCSGVYILNLADKLFGWFVEASKSSLVGNPLFDPLKVEFFFRSSFDDPKTFGTLTFSRLFNKLVSGTKRVSFSDVMYYQEAHQRFVSATVQIGDEYLVICENMPRSFSIAGKIASTKVVNVIPILHLQEIETTHITGVTNEFTLVDALSNARYTLALEKRAEIMRTVYFVRSRMTENAEAGEDDLEEDATDWVGYLFNACFAGLVSSSEAIRSSSFSLLSSLCETFDLGLGRQLRITSNVRFPKDNTTFIVSISAALARTYPDATYIFIENFCRVYHKLPTNEKLASVMYLAPWIANIYKHVFATDDETGTEKTSELVRMLTKISTLEDEFLPVFNTHVWSTLCLEDKLSSILLEEIVAVAVDLESEGVDWNDVIGLISLTPTIEICCGVINRLKEVSHIPSHSGELSMITQTSWIEITILVKICVSLFFDSLFFTEMFLPDVLFIITMFLDIGPLRLRKALYGLTINVLHSFLAKEDLSEAILDKMNLVNHKLTGQRAKIVFGLTRNESTVDSDSNRVVSGLNGLEYFCGHLNEFLDYATDGNMKSVWRVRWNAYVIDAAFRNGSLLQPRALLILGFLARSGVTDNLVGKLLDLVSIIADEHCYSKKDESSFLCGVYAISRVVDGLPLSSVFFPKLFWLASQLCQTNSPLIFQAATQCMSRILIAYCAVVIVPPATYYDTLFEVRSKTLTVLDEFDALQEIRFTRDNFDVCVAWIVMRGLQIPRTKQTCVELYQTLFQGRQREEIGKWRCEPEAIFSNSHMCHLLFIFILSKSNSEIEAFMDTCDLDDRQYVLLGEGIKAPKVLIEFVMETNRNTVTTFYLAASYIVSKYCDDHTRFRFMLITRHAGHRNPDLLYKIYFVVRPFFKKIITGIYPLQFLGVGFDISTYVCRIPGFTFNESEQANMLDAIMKEHNVLGLKNWEFQPNEPEMKALRVLKFQETIHQLLANFIETE